MGLEWMPMKHRDEAEVMLLLLSGPFGKLNFRTVAPLD